MTAIFYCRLDREYRRERKQQKNGIVIKKQIQEDTMDRSTNTSLKEMIFQNIYKKIIAEKQMSMTLFPALVQILQNRFGGIPKEIENNLEKTYDSKVLSRLIAIAISATSLEDVMKAIEKYTAKPWEA